jgi:hypothetical protein
MRQAVLLILAAVSLAGCLSFSSSNPSPPPSGMVVVPAR